MVAVFPRCRFAIGIPTCLAGESNTVLPDPKDGNILYGMGGGGGAGGSGFSRCDQNLNI